jgi:hypothetical protein
VRKFGRRSALLPGCKPERKKKIRKFGKVKTDAGENADLGFSLISRLRISLIFIFKKGDSSETGWREEEDKMSAELFLKIKKSELEMFVLGKKNMAERKRFELLRGFLPCTLSKGVPSTTRPSLRMKDKI